MPMNNSRSRIQIVIEDIYAAFMLLTRIPVNWQKISPNTPPNLNRCLWVYPVVGVVVSLIGAIIYLGTQALDIPQMTSILLSLSAMIITTGAFHEDGLADTMDGFGGGASPEKKLEIMRDSRIGTYGGLALIISIGLKVTGLSALSAGNVVSALLVGATVSRLMIIFTLMMLPPARKKSLSVEAGKPSTKSVIVASTITILVCLTLQDIITIIYVLSAAIVSTAMFCRLSYKQVGGYSGDILGSTQQISEISIYLTLCAIWSI